MGTRSRKRPELAVAAALASGGLLLAACQPPGLPGVDEDQLKEAISRAVGDPNTCVLIAERGSGRTLYQYNSATPCANEWPGCEGPGALKVGRLAKLTAQDGRTRTLSCYTMPDRSRSVGWAAGPVPGRDWVYAAVMEGDRAFPGMMMEDRLKTAFRRAGVTPPAK